MNRNHREDDEQGIGKEEFCRPLLGEVTLHKAKVIHIEHKHKRKRHDDKAHIAFHRYRLGMTSGEKEWHTKENAPCHRVNDASHADRRIAHNLITLLVSYRFNRV